MYNDKFQEEILCFTADLGGHEKSYFLLVIVSHHCHFTVSKDYVKWCGL